MKVRLMIGRQKLGTQCDKVTTLFPDSSSSDERIAGFVVFQYYKKHTLKVNINFQQMLVGNMIFTTYTDITLGSNKQVFFEKIM